MPEALQSIVLDTIKEGEVIEPSTIPQPVPAAKKKKSAKQPATDVGVPEPSTAVKQESVDGQAADIGVSEPAAIPVAKEESVLEPVPPVKDESASEAKAPKPEPKSKPKSKAKSAKGKGQEEGICGGGFGK